MHSPGDENGRSDPEKKILCTKLGGNVDRRDRLKLRLRNKFEGDVKHVGCRNCRLMCSQEWSGGSPIRTSSAFHRCSTNGIRWFILVQENGKDHRFLTWQLECYCKHWTPNLEWVLKCLKFKFMWKKSTRQTSVRKSWLFINPLISFGYCMYYHVLTFKNSERNEVFCMDFRRKSDYFPTEFWLGLQMTVCVYCVAKNKHFNIIQVNFNMCRVNTIGPLRAV